MARASRFSRRVSQSTAAAAAYVFPNIVFLRFTSLNPGSTRLRVLLRTYIGKTEGNPGKQFERRKVGESGRMKVLKESARRNDRDVVVTVTRIPSPLVPVE